MSGQGHGYRSMKRSSSLSVSSSNGSSAAVSKVTSSRLIGLPRWFVIGSEHSLRRTLVIPKETFEDADFAGLLNVQLVTALKLAGGVRITLTPQGARH